MSSGWSAAGQALLAMPRQFLILLVRSYRLFLKPVLGNRCRFAPTCSEYALEALRLHGAARGTGLAVYRLVRCNPLCAGGHDPVPAPDSISPLFKLRSKIRP